MDDFAGLDIVGLDNEGLDIAGLARTQILRYMPLVKTMPVPLSRELNYTT